MVDVSVVAVQAASGFVVGALIGYAIRKAAGFLITLAGLWLTSIAALAYIGVVSVNWSYLGALVSQFLSWLGIVTSDFQSFITSSGVFGLSAGVGFLMGAGYLHSVEEPPRRRRFIKREGGWEFLRRDDE